MERWKGGEKQNQWDAVFCSNPTREEEGRDWKEKSADRTAEAKAVHKMEGIQVESRPVTGCESLGLRASVIISQ